MKQRKTLGFTLMEMLVVAAIVAILTAVSVPVFTSQIKKTKEATCAANCRSLKALLVTSYLSDGDKSAVEALYQSKKGEFTCPLGGSYILQIRFV